VGVVAQSLSSLTNFVAAVLVARALSPAEFGAFSVAFAAYLVPLGISRALGSEVLVVRFAAQSQEDRRRGVQASAGSALLVALAGLAPSFWLLFLFRALLGIGSTFEGIFRNHMIMPGGRLRHSAYYSVVAEEWPAVKARLEAAIRPPA